MVSIYATKEEAVDSAGAFTLEQHVMVAIIYFLQISLVNFVIIFTSWHKTAMFSTVCILPYFIGYCAEIFLDYYSSKH